MDFMKRKNKYKFSVELNLEELTAVPFVNGVLFSKLRLLDGGRFVAYSTRQEVRNHSVMWNHSFKFVCKIFASASSGILDDCILRVSVRKESNGGKACHKLGFVELNLSEFAGSGLCRRRCLLEAYETQRHYRPDNSMLKLDVRVDLMAGDVLFKAPSPSLRQAQLNVPGSVDSCNLSIESLASTDASFRFESHYSDTVNHDSSSDEGSFRMKLTRPDPDALVEEIFRASDLNKTTLPEEDMGLQLFIGKDGSTALKSPGTKSVVSRGGFKRVVMEENRR